MTSVNPVEWFWGVVAETDWATRQTQPIEEGQRFLKERLSSEEIAAFDAQLQFFRFELHRVLTEYEEESGEEFETGDDGFDDLVCHIIGLGRQEYEAVVANPHLALQRAQSGDYKESFRYLVPWPDDTQ